MSRPRKNPKTVDKTCKTCKKQFVVSYNKKKQLYCNRSCANLDPEVLKKINSSKQKTYDKKYNGLHPMQISDVVNKLKKSKLEKHNDENYNNPLKTKSTKLEKYGTENYFNVEKYKKTCLAKYGKNYFIETDSFRDKTQKTCLEKYGVDHPSKSRTFKISHNESMFKKFMSNERFVNFSPEFTIEEYQGVTDKFNKKYPFRCNRCDLVSAFYISDGKWPMCPICDKKVVSSFQEDVQNYVSSILDKNDIIIKNDRSVLYPQEIDIYIPSKKLAIECDGLYWHSELLGKKNKLYHLQKTKKCIKKEIRMIHIFENEWYQKNEIVKSVLNHILKTKDIKRIHARDCEVKILDKSLYFSFVEKNHLQGKDNPSIIYGLFSGSELVSVMSFCKSRFTKKYEYELSRYCNKLNYSVSGAASKLFNHFIKDKNPNNIISYCDRRYFSGKVYDNLGFVFMDNTPPNYFYIMDKYKSLKNRMTFQKHRLSKILNNFDSNLSEWQNMVNNGFDRIWDCGNIKWIWKK